MNIFFILNQCFPVDVSFKFEPLRFAQAMITIRSFRFRAKLFFFCSIELFMISTWSKKNLVDVWCGVACMCTRITYYLWCHQCRYSEPFLIKHYSFSAALLFLCISRALKCIFLNIFGGRVRCSWNDYRRITEYCKRCFQFETRNYFEDRIATWIIKQVRRSIMVHECGAVIHHWSQLSYFSYFWFCRVFRKVDEEAQV